MCTFVATPRWASGVKHLRWQEHTNLTHMHSPTAVDAACNISFHRVCGAFEWARSHVQLNDADGCHECYTACTVMPIMGVESMKRSSTLPLAQVLDVLAVAALSPPFQAARCTAAIPATSPAQCIYISKGALCVGVKSTLP